VKKLSGAAKGLRKEPDPTAISPQEFREYLQEMKRRPGTPIPCMQDDVATVQGLIDVLIVDGILAAKGGVSPDERIIRYMDRYNSIVTALVMILVEDGIISEKKMELGILAFHHAIRHFGQRSASFEEVSTFRRDSLRMLFLKEGLNGDAG
jgi:hypothetical protein